MPIVLVSLPILTAECATRREFGLSRREESANGSQSRLLARVATAKKIEYGGVEWWKHWVMKDEQLAEVARRRVLRLSSSIPLWDKNFLNSKSLLLSLQLPLRSLPTHVLPPQIHTLQIADGHTITNLDISSTQPSVHTSPWLAPPTPTSAASTTPSTRSSNNPPNSSHTSPSQRSHTSPKTSAHTSSGHANPQTRTPQTLKPKSRHHQPASQQSTP